MQDATSFVEELTTSFRNHLGTSQFPESHGALADDYRTEEKIKSEDKLILGPVFHAHLVRPGKDQLKSKELRVGRVSRRKTTHHLGILRTSVNSMLGT